MKVKRGKIIEIDNFEVKRLEMGMSWFKLYADDFPEVIQKLGFIADEYEALIIEDVNQLGFALLSKGKGSIVYFYQNGEKCRIDGKVYTLSRSISCN